MKNPWVVYQYLFYKIYMWDKKDPRGKQKTAFIVLSWVALANFLLFLSIIRIFIARDVIDQPLSKLGMLGIGSIFFILNYFFFIRNKRYKKVIKKFSKESEQEKRRGNIFTVGYVYVSFIIYPMALYLSIHFFPVSAVIKQERINSVTQTIKSNQYFFPDNDKLVLPVRKDFN